MLFTNCILSLVLPPQAIRISVMSRHTFNDGKTSDERLVGQFDLHFSILGPSPKLIGDYYNRGLSWRDFEIMYVDEIRNGEKRLAVNFLGEMALQRDVVVLCIEEFPDRCHRRLLAEECKSRFPNLGIVIQ